MSWAYLWPPRHKAAICQGQPSTQGLIPDLCNRINFQLYFGMQHIGTLDLRPTVINVTSE